MADFPHLPLPQIVERRNYLGRRIPRAAPRRSADNLANRKRHSTNLTSDITNLELAWKTEYESLTDAPLQEYIDPRVIPIFLRIDIKSLDVDALKGFGIEIISQEDDGLIIGASLDAFEKLKLKIDRFDKGLDKGTAYLWEIDNGVAWKRDFILSPELNAKLDRLPDNEVLELDFSIACNISLGLKPIIKDGETARKYQVRLDRWEQKARARDDIQIARYNQFEAIINIYGTIRSMFDYYDSFGIRAEITAKGLKDILFNYPYVFEIVEHDYLEGIFEEAPESRDFNVQIIAPSVTAPKVCVIDSGIMEGHRLLAPAIDTANSKSYVNGEGPADLVEGGGHGTRVAGAILYPSGISGNGNVQLPCWIQNAKVLNQRTLLPNSLFPPQLMRQIVHDYLPTKIYNLSITSFTPCRLNHMSLWAASIDKLTWEHDIIFVIAVGNLLKRGINAKPGIVDFLNKGLNYPDYLLSESFCRIANPSQSSFSLSVGSVTIGEFEDDYRISFAKSSGLGVGPSPFSRTGLGLWGMIKPDVVEFGGDLVREKQQNPNIIEHADTSPHLVKSIRTSNDATGKDRVGTSFAAPKVSHIVASLQENFSTQNSLFYRGLVIHSARLPDYAFNNPNVDYLRHFGYGIPNLNRALDNTQKRITLYTNGLINAKHADIYSLIIPREINNPGADFDVLVELTLSYKAEPRRTRMRTNSYLSHWLDWKTSKVGETFAEFQTRIINAPNDENDEFEEDELDPFVQAKPELPWKIRERTNLGDIRDIKRQDNTAQKDWMIVKSYQLSEIIGIAIMGHKGWSVDLEDTIPYCLFVSFEILTPEINVNIYEEIRLANRIEIPVEVRV